MAKYTEFSSGCWPWTGYRNRDGYGTLQIWDADHYVHRLAHRVQWELVNGPIPEGLKVLHSCDNPPCIRPSHLFLGTDAVNVADKMRKGRHGGSNRGQRLIGRQGEDQVGSKLTDAQVLRIRHLAATEPRGIQRQLGIEYGVSEELISRIKLRKCWTHI